MHSSYRSRKKGGNMDEKMEKNDFETSGMNEDDQSSEESMDEDESREEFDEDRKPDAFLEYRKPHDSETDYNQLKLLISEVFADIPVDLENLIKFFIKNNLTQVAVVFGKDKDDNLPKIPFGIVGIVTYVDLTKTNEHCIKRLKKQILDLSKKYSSDYLKNLVGNLLSNDNIDLKFILNETTEFMDPQICIKMMEYLLKDNTKDTFNDSDYFFYISKIFKVTEKSKKMENKIEQAAEELVVWLNPQDETFAEEATGSFEFPVDPKTVKELPNVFWGFGPENWQPEDYDTAVPYRRILLIKLDKLKMIVKKLKEKFVA